MVNQKQLKRTVVLGFAVSLFALGLLSLSSCQASKNDDNQSLEQLNQQQSPADSAGFEGLNFVDDRKATKQAFIANQQKWQSQALEDYSINFQRSCFCPQEFVQPLQLTIHQGTIEKVEDSNAKAVAEQVAQSTKTVAQVFALIEKALDKAEQIDAKYHPQYGYPTEVFIDRSKRMADEEVRIRLNDLRF